MEPVPAVDTMPIPEQLPTFEVLQTFIFELALFIELIPATTSELPAVSKAVTVASSPPQTELEIIPSISKTFEDLPSSPLS